MKTLRERPWADYSWVWRGGEGLLGRLREGQSEVVLEIDGYELKLTQMDSVFWPGGRGRKTVTKRDFLSYLVRISPHLIKHMKHRPVTLTRYPQGITGEWSFHRHWEGALPPFVETATIYSEHSHFDRRYLMCNNLATLLWLGEVANLELRPWFSRVCVEPDTSHLSSNFTGPACKLDRSVLNYPDFMVFDLDPYFCSSGESDDGETDLIAFRKCREVAFWLKDILEALSLSPFVKTSGRAGLHLFVPILRNMDYPHVRSAAAAIAWLMLQEHPQDVTTEWSVAKRTGKLLLDYNQNIRGKTLPWVYSPIVDNAGLVSMPVRWEELWAVNPSEFTMEASIERLQSEGDLWAGILEARVDMSHMYMPPI